MQVRWWGRVFSTVKRTQTQCSVTPPAKTRIPMSRTKSTSQFTTCPAGPQPVVKPPLHRCGFNPVLHAEAWFSSLHEIDERLENMCLRSSHDLKFVGNVASLCFCIGVCNIVMGGSTHSHNLMMFSSTHPAPRPSTRPRCQVQAQRHPAADRLDVWPAADHDPRRQGDRIAPSYGDRTSLWRIAPSYCESHPMVNRTPYGESHPLWRIAPSYGESHPLMVNRIFLFRIVFFQAYPNPQNVISNANSSGGVNPSSTRHPASQNVGGYDSQNQPKGLYQYEKPAATFGRFVQKPNPSST